MSASEVVTLTQEESNGEVDSEAEVPVAPEEVLAMTEGGGVELIDVRTPHEWRAGRIPGSRHVPLNELPKAASELEQGRPLLIYCRGGNRSAFAAEGLRSAGFQARSVAGGALAWAESDLPLEPSDGYIAESGEAAAELEARERSGRRPPGIDW